MDIILKSVLGGICIGLIFYFSEKSHYHLSGLLPMFPALSAVAILAWGAANARTVAIYTLLSVLVWLCFSLTFIFLAKVTDWRLALLAAFAAWFIAAYAYWQLTSA